MNGLPVPLRQVDRTRVEVAGRRLAYFAGCDYYRLAGHPKVIAAAREALENLGFGVSASRLTTGNHPLFEELEVWLAAFFKAPRAVLVGAGYAANPVVAQALAGQVTHVFLDAGAHGSLLDAMAFLGITARIFLHRDPDDLRRRLARLPGGSRPLVATDGLFGRDGAVAPLAHYLNLLPSRGRLLVDDAHGAGVLGNDGRGTAEFCGVEDDRLIRTATLSKAFGAYGGVVLADAKLAARIHAHSRWFGASTPVPLPAAAGALAAGRLIQEDGAMRERLRHHATLLKEALRPLGFPETEHPSPILAVYTRSTQQAERLSQLLTRSGVYPSLIRYPGSPRQGYFRFAVSSEHDAAQLEALGGALTAFVEGSLPRAAGAHVPVGADVRRRKARRSLAADL